MASLSVVVVEVRSQLLVKIDVRREAVRANLNPVLLRQVVLEGSEPFVGRELWEVHTIQAHQLELAGTVYVCVS